MAPDRQVDQLLGRVFRREGAPGLDRFSDDPIEAFDRIRGVDHAPDLGAEGEERDDLLPGPAPGLGDRGVLPAPVRVEGLQRVPGRFGGLGDIDLAQLGGTVRNFVCGRA